MLLCSYREIHSEEDVTLQKDLDIIVQWAQMWLMKLNLVKCEHLTITNQKNPRSSIITSKVITSPKLNPPNIWVWLLLITYLGMIILFSFVTRPIWHMRFCKKPQTVLPLIKSHAYLTYVRPILEYASTVWLPHTKTDITRLNAKLLTLFLINFQLTTVTSMLSHQSWQSLEERRINAITVIF